MRLIWTGESLKRLIEIEEYIAEDNPVKAEEFIVFLIERAELLSEKPRMGRIVPEFSNPEIREIIARNYRIVYRIKKSIIEILTVFEGHRLIREDEIMND